MADQAPAEARDLDVHPDADDDAAAAVYEHAHVHTVYDAIADHFSATRHSPWPLVARFLAAQPPGAVGLDVGCGNGKYLLPENAENAGHFRIGSDRSPALAATAHARAAGRGRPPRADVVVADALALPFRAACADFAVCIAVVHHLATRARRQAAVTELLGCVRPAAAAAAGAAETDGPNTFPRGRVLLYVWALEQASSRRGWAAGGAQDLLVPWVKTTPRPKGKTRTEKNKKTPGTAGDKTQQPASGPDAQAGTHAPEDSSAAPATFHRYYHLYREGELEEDVAAAGGRVVAHGYEKDNWWVIADPV